MNGFVYILDNEFMPDLIKIGCSERSPHSRAQELSSSTGVPGPFRVLCYAEFPDFQTVERNMHEWCRNHRVSSNREFFSDCLLFAVQLLYWHHDRLSFTDVTATPGCAKYKSELLLIISPEGELVGTFDDLRNPYGVAEQEAEKSKLRMSEHQLLYGVATVPSSQVEPLALEAPEAVQ